jgi:hypothetical protein
MPLDASPGRPAAQHATVSDALDALTPEQWADLARRLTRYAFNRMRRLARGAATWEEAENVAQEAFSRLLDPAFAEWDRERHPEVFDALGYVVNGLAVNWARRRRVRAAHVPILDDVDANEDDAPLDPRSEGDRAGEGGHGSGDGVVLSSRDGDEGLAAREERRAERAFAMLEARLADDPLALGLLGLIREGEGRPAEQARRLGRDVGDVYTAKRRLLHHGRIVAREIEEGGS